MVTTVTHATAAVGTDSGDDKVSKDAWDEGHTVVIDFGEAPGAELDYVEKTSNTSVTATTEATADPIVTGSAVAYDGSTIVLIEFFCNIVFVPATVTASLWLYDGASSIGRVAEFISPDATNGYEVPVLIRRRLTPSAASHTYSIRGSTSSGTTTWVAGAGGAATNVPAFIRITKV